MSMFFGLIFVGVVVFVGVFILDVFVKKKIDINGFYVVV